MQDIVIACEDLFGLEIYSIIQEINHRLECAGRNRAYNPIGFLAKENIPFTEKNHPLPIVGHIEDWRPKMNEKVVLGIQNPQSKKNAVNLLRSHNAEFATIIAPWMLAIENEITIGDGCIIAPYSAKAGLIIGNYVTIIGSMLSGHKIDDYSTVMRFANIAGDAIGKNSYVGDHCFLAVGKKIGDRCYAEAGSIIVKDVKSDTSVSGVPAAKMRK